MQRLVGCLASVLLLSGCAAGRTVPAASPVSELCIADTAALARPGLEAAVDGVARPGVLIAWRNTEKILEIETQVCNRSPRPRSAQLSLALVGADGNVLASHPEGDRPFVVDVPAVDDGGSAGVTVQVPGTVAMNRLLDNLDRAGSPYCVELRLGSPGRSENRAETNATAKCYNTASRMTPGGKAFHQFVLRNTDERPLAGVLRLDGTGLPDGWNVVAHPAPGSRVVLHPGEQLIGSLIVEAPPGAEEGEFVDLRPVVAADDGHVAWATEFFTAVDSTPPRVVDATVEPSSERGFVHVSVRAVDAVSGVAEASGAKVVWSTDGGITAAVRTAAYVEGNFFAPTGFETDLGPFPDGTRLTLHVVVEDVAGNQATTRTVGVTVPVAGRTVLAGE